MPVIPVNRVVDKKINWIKWRARRRRGTMVADPQKRKKIV
jgi:hypothetical protein